MQRDQQLSGFSLQEPFPNIIKRWTTTLNFKNNEATIGALSTPGHENKTYSLGGSASVSFADIAKILSEIKGRPVPFTTITADEYKDMIAARGLPPHVAGFIPSWAVAMEKGEFEYQSGDLERLLGRKTQNLSTYIASALA